MSRWFRVYDDLVDDPKVQQLPGPLFKALINLWCLTSKNGGTIPSNEVIAFKLRIPESKVAAILASLQSAGLFDCDETGSRPHNWNQRQFKSDVSNERVKQHRQRRRNVTSTVTATPPETEYRNRAETERKKDAASAAPALDQDADLFRRGKEVLGENAGGLIKLLKQAKGSIPLARAAIEQASTRQEPREYIAGIIKKRDPTPREVQVDPRL